MAYLDNYIADVRVDPCFTICNDLGVFATKMVETNCTDLRVLATKIVEAYR